MRAYQAMQRWLQEPCPHITSYAGTRGECLYRADRACLLALFAEEEERTDAPTGG